MNIKIIIVTLFAIIWTQGYNVQLLSHLPYGQETSDITGFYQDDLDIIQSYRADYPSDYREIPKLEC